jgi:hypothetical protein
MARQVNIITRGIGHVGSLLIGRTNPVLNLTGSAAPTNGASGTGAGLANPGSSYFDTTNGVAWINVGTKAAPVWSPLQPRSFAISSANILGMNATPVALIADPPAGYAVIVNGILFIMTRTATAYANGGVVTFVYTGGAVVAHAGAVAAAVITGGAGTELIYLGTSDLATGAVVPTAKGISITNATAAFITGTGTAVARIDYRLVKQAA